MCHIFILIYIFESSAHTLFCTFVPMLRKWWHIKTAGGLLMALQQYRGYNIESIVKGGEGFK